MCAYSDRGMMLFLYRNHQAHMSQKSERKMNRFHSFISINKCAFRNEKVNFYSSIEKFAWRFVGFPSINDDIIKYASNTMRMFFITNSGLDFSFLLSCQSNGELSREQSSQISYALSHSWQLWVERKTSVRLSFLPKVSHRTSEINKKWQWFCPHNSKQDA